MEKYKPLLVALAVFVAVAAPLSAAVKAHKEQSRWPIVKFIVEPYDPRDLLYGHYMTFQIVWNWKKDQKPLENTAETCLCVGAGDYNPEVSLTECPKQNVSIPSCSHIIKGEYYSTYISETETGHNFQSGIDRYYVDENLALPLEQLFRDKKEEFSIGLGMNPKGKPVVEKLYVGGKTISQYVSEKGGVLTMPSEAEAVPADEPSAVDVR